MVCVKLKCFARLALCALLSFIIIAPTCPAFADEDTSITESEKTRLAGDLISAAMDLVLERYKYADELTPEYLYENALRGVMAGLDEYSAYLSPNEIYELERGFSGQLYGVGITLIQANGETRIGVVVNDSPAEREGLRPGDLVYSVNGADVNDMDVQDILSLIAQTNTVIITLERDGAQTDISLQKAQIKFQTVFARKFDELIDTASNKGNRDCGYMYISEFGDETPEEFARAISSFLSGGIKHVVIDLRKNPGGYADSVIDVCNQILPEGPIMHTVDRKGGYVTYKSTLKEKVFEKIVVLTDRYTASAAEVLASALQDADAAIIVGERTFGKGVIQSLYPLPVGGALKFTTEEYLRRSGEKIDEIGVTPNVIMDCDTDIYIPAQPAFSTDDKFLQKAYELLLSR
jgi:carboxyl-terminal processing protease